MIVETRSGAAPVTVRAATSSGVFIVGYAARFYDRADPGTQFTLAPGLVERIARNAFDAALRRGDDVRGLFNHDANFVLGRTKAGTLRLVADSRGLRYEIRPTDSSVAHDVASWIKAGEVSGSSFGFVGARSRFTEERMPGGDWLTVRIVEDIGRLLDVGPVTYPEYSATSATVA